MKICPNCNTKMSDTYTTCSVCGASLCDMSEYNPQLFHNRRKSQSSKTLIIVLAVIAALVGGCIYYYSYNNENALMLYNMTYNSLHNSDSTYVSSATKNLIAQANEKAESIFISKENREKIQTLDKDIKDFEVLARVENRLLNGNTASSIRDAITEFNSISSYAVAASSRFTELKPYIKAMEFKYDNKSWAEGKIQDFKTNHSELISSWSRNNYVVYHTGLATGLIETETGISFYIEDYEGNMIDVYMAYSEDDWNDTIDEMRNILKLEKTCVVAVAAAENYYSDHIFLISHKTN